MGYTGQREAGAGISSNGIKYEFRDYTAAVVPVKMHTGTVAADSIIIETGGNIAVIIVQIQPDTKGGVVVYMVTCENRICCPSIGEITIDSC